MLTSVKLLRAQCSLSAA